ncbi:YoaK family protein [Arthrobacter ginkgonis]|uniref:YoaK family protein n=1 Tax=Arthrobacter ginkgonis TaxID=1630594 RepID=A0ABP7BP66_9MICC
MLKEKRNARMRLSLMMALTFVTGALDAVGYLGLDRIFTGNMTGNIVILGMAAAGGNGLPVLGPALALVAFVLGAAVAGAVLKRRSSGWNVRVTVLLGIGTVMLSVAGVVLTQTDTHPEWIRVAMACAIAVQMGSQALIARFLAVKDMTTVVVTSTLASLAGESFFGSGSRLWNRRFAAVAVLFAGATAGTGLMHLHLSVPVFVAAAITAAVTITGMSKWNLPEEATIQAPELQTAKQ